MQQPTFAQGWSRNPGQSRPMRRGRGRVAQVENPESWAAMGRSGTATGSHLHFGQVRGEWHKWNGRRADGRSPTEEAIRIVPPEMVRLGADRALNVLL